MLEISDDAAAIMTGSYTMVSRVESWRGGDLLDGDIPVSSGTESVDVTQVVPESATLTVPRLHEGVSYVPGADQDAPLAAWGQRLHISLGVVLAGGVVEWIGRRWLYITDAQPDSGDGITVTAAGLLGLLSEAPFVSPVPPICNGNQVRFGTMIKKMCEPALHVDLSGAPTDRLLPIDTVFADSRIDSLNEILTMWPATAYVDQDGVLVVVPTHDADTPVLALSDADRGTAMRWGADVSREGAANCVLARGYTSTGANVQAVAYDTDPMSPTRYGGPFSALPVPYELDSSLLTSVAECAAAAKSQLRTLRSQAARRLVTTAVPQLALQERDAITVTSETEGVLDALAIIDQLTMPLTADSGGMTVGARLK